jgi:hypothetical protein
MPLACASREVEAYKMLFYAGMEPYTWRISFDDLALLDPAELVSLPDTIKSELDKDDDPDRKLGEMKMLRAVLDEAREEMRQEREDKEREDKEREDKG